MCVRAAVNLHKSCHVLFIHVVDVRLRKMTLHTRRAPNNCGASGRASRTEIKQVLSHNPCLAKNKPVQTRVVDSRLHPQLWLWRQLFDKCGAMRKRLYITVCLCSSASVTYRPWMLLIQLQHNTVRTHHPTWKTTKKSYIFFPFFKKITNKRLYRQNQARSSR